IEAAGVHACDSVEEMYKTCQFISLHLPATDETKNSIGRKYVSLMPKGAVLVNSARKEIINEEELIQLMQERTDLKFVSDIAPAAAEKFQELFADRYFATPKKMGAQTAEANINAGIAAANQIAGFFKDGCTRFMVNK
ncbi:MAG: 3-phosphoglycerate dehydrogenase, partial [Bacteroidetes bacterium]|nr:3-phosphoglycerate dehydrogenase [Candidatus Colenecus caballi]